MITELRWLIKNNGKKVLQSWKRFDGWQDVPTVKEEPKTVTITRAQLFHAYQNWDERTGGFDDLVRRLGL